MSKKKKSANAKIKSSKKMSRKATAVSTKSKTQKASPKTKSRADKFLGSLKTIIDKVAEKADVVVTVFQDDIVTALKKDHDSLREFLGTLKDTSKPMQERRKAYELFASLLKSHTIAEENAVYKTSMTLKGHEMHMKIAEGFVEHELADDTLRRMEEHVDDSMSWSAHANVLAEIVEHHLKEEEDDLFPMIRKNASTEENAEMLSLFLALRQETQETVREKNSGALEMTELNA